MAAVVAVFGWWGNGRLRQTIESQLQADLTATLEANVTALDIWATNQTKLVLALADDPKVRELAAKILETPPATTGNPGRPSNRPEMEEFDAYLRPRLSTLGYGIARLVSTNFVYVATSAHGRPPPRSSVYDEHVAKFSELFASGQPVIIIPFKPKPPRSFGLAPGMSRSPGGESRSRFNFPGLRRDRPDGSGGPGRPFGPGGAGPPDFARFRPGDGTLMQVAAPVRDDHGTLRGALALIVNPDTEFTRILSVARSGESGETYAFDQQGMMISRSRFDDQLKRLGLIENRPGASSALNLRLSDPGSDRPAQIVREDLASPTRPLMRMVAAAVAGRSGVDVSPARDYRGVPVVGAWRWLPHHGFGVATQIDADEAYQPLRVLKLLFLLLTLLLLLSAIGLLLFSYWNIVWRRRLSEAELRLKQLGQYTLEEQIGEGGMGVVYRARHALMRRETAVKLLLPDRADPVSIQRFEREVRLTCQLTHPNTIQVYDYGHTPEGIFYYAMEYLNGLNLNELVAGFGLQPESRVIHILTQVCEALSEAHALGLVHRDIKPANVFLCDRGGIADCVKVLDFGLVREFRGISQNQTHLTGDQAMVGTPWFMPPEAFKNPTQSDPRTDIYSIGALGYYLLTGQHVFEAENVLTLFEKHLQEPPVPPSRRTTNPISAELETALLRCLEKDPKRRPQSVVELRLLIGASPRASEWTVEARAAWWDRYRNQAAATVREAGAWPSGPVEATVKIDFQDRLNEPPSAMD